MSWDFSDPNRALTPNRDPYIEVRADAVGAGDALLMLRSHGFWGTASRVGHSAAVWGEVVTADRPKRARTCYLTVRVEGGEIVPVQLRSTWPVLIRDDVSPQ